MNPNTQHWTITRELVYALDEARAALRQGSSLNARLTSNGPTLGQIIDWAIERANVSQGQ